jgi:PST family polysaccharide transporter
MTRPNPVVSQPAVISEHWFGHHAKRSIVGVGVWAAAGNAGGALLSLIGTVVLSRLLTPAEVGLFTLAFTFYSIPSLILGPGLTSAAIQAPHLTQAQSSNLFWINTLANSILALLLVAATPFLAHYFQQPQLRSLCPLFAIILALEGVATQYRALLQRALRFDLITKIHLFVGVVSLAVAITLAWFGFGVWALALQVLVGAILDRVALARVVGWRPSWFHRGVGTRSLMHFSGRSSLALGIHMLYTQSQSLLIGRYATVSDVAFYNRGAALFQKPFSQLLEPLYAVLLPKLSAQQHDMAKFSSSVYRANAMLYAMLPPLVVWMMVSGREIAVMLLGEQWRLAGDALFWFALWAIPGLLFGTLYKANTAIGRPAWGVGIRVAFLPVLLGALFWAAPRGAAAMAAVGAGVEWASAPLIFWLLLKDGPVPSRFFASAIVESLVAFAIALGTAWYLRPFLDGLPGPHILRVVASLVSCYAIGLLVAVAFPYGRAALAEWAALVRNGLSKARMGAA